MQAWFLSDQRMTRSQSSELRYHYHTLFSLYKSHSDFRVTLNNTLLDSMLPRTSLLHMLIFFIDRLYCKFELI